MKVNCNLISCRRPKDERLILKRMWHLLSSGLSAMERKFVCIHFGKTRVSPQQTFQPKEKLSPRCRTTVFSNARKILCSRLGLKSRYHSAKSRNASQFTTSLNRLLCIRNRIVNGWRARTFHVKFMSFSIELFIANSAAFSCTHCWRILQRSEGTCAKLFLFTSEKSSAHCVCDGKIYFQGFEKWILIFRRARHQ